MVTLMSMIIPLQQFQESDVVQKLWIQSYVLKATFWQLFYQTLFECFCPYVLKS